MIFKSLKKQHHSHKGFVTKGNVLMGPIHVSLNGITIVQAPIISAVHEMTKVVHNYTVFAGVAEKVTKKRSTNDI